MEHRTEKELFNKERHRFNEEVANYRALEEHNILNFEEKYACLVSVTENLENEKSAHFKTAMQGVKDAKLKDAVTKQLTDTQLKLSENMTGKRIAASAIQTAGGSSQNGNRQQATSSTPARATITVADGYTCGHEQDLLTIIDRSSNAEGTASHAERFNRVICPECIKDPKAFAALTIRRLESALNFNKDLHSKLLAANKNGTELEPTPSNLPLMKTSAPFMSRLRDESKTQTKLNIDFQHGVEMLYLAKFEEAIRAENEGKVVEYRQLLWDSKEVSMQLLEYTMETVGQESVYAYKKGEIDAVLSRGNLGPNRAPAGNQVDEDN